MSRPYAFSIVSCSVRGWTDDAALPASMLGSLLLLKGVWRAGQAPAGGERAHAVGRPQGTRRTAGRRPAAGVSHADRIFLETTRRVAPRRLAQEDVRIALQLAPVGPG